MNNNHYLVMIDNVVIAKGMSLGNALILVKALFQEYYMDNDLSILIAKEADNDAS